MKRFKVCRDIGGGYCVDDVLSDSPWAKEFNLTKSEAIKEAKRLNKKQGWKLSFWDKIFHTEAEARKYKYRKQLKRVA